MTTAHPEPRADYVVPLRWLRPAVLALVVVLAIALRLTFFAFESADYTVFLAEWYSYLQQHGFSAFGDEFANYGLPYLYLLGIAAALKIPALVAVKLISLVFELVLAGAVWLVVRHFRPGGQVALFAAVGTLLLPTVILNGSMWGQSDAIYAAFTVLAFWAVLKDRSLLVWVFWAIAFDVKFQAVFFLPVLAFVWLRTERRRWFYPAVVVPVYLLACVPALIAGRSLGSILAIYANFAGTVSPLASNAVTAYQWVPQSLGLWFQYGGILFAAIAIAMLLVAGLQLDAVQRFDSVRLLQFATLLLFVTVFMLPQMHDRYFYLAEIFAVVLAASTGRVLYLLVALAAQFTAFFVYGQFLFNQPSVIALPVLSLVQLGVILVLAATTLRRQAAVVA